MLIYWVNAGHSTCRSNAYSSLSPSPRIDGFPGYVGKASFLCRLPITSSSAGSLSAGIFGCCNVSRYLNCIVLLL